MYWSDCHTQSAEVYEYNIHYGFRLVINKDTILCTWISWTARQHVVLVSCQIDWWFLPWYLLSHSTHVIPDDGKWGQTCLNKHKKLFYVFKLYLFDYAHSSLCSNCWIHLLDHEDEGTMYLENNGNFVWNGTV